MKKKLLLRRISKWLMEPMEGNPVLREYSKRLKGTQ
jgi:hypothetical protein